MDYRASWEAWAGKTYPNDPGLSQAVAQAAIVASSRGSSQWEAAVEGHRAAVRAGGEYRCRPDRAGMVIAICVVLFLMLVPATLAGLSVNPAFLGFVILGLAVALPVIGVAGVIKVRRNSCLFVNREMLGRRNWRGRVVASVARANIESLAVRSGDWSKVLLSDEGPEESTLEVRTARGSAFPTTDLFWWSKTRIRELAAVAAP